MQQDIVVESFTMLPKPIRGSGFGDVGRLGTSCMFDIAQWRSSTSSFASSFSFSFCFSDYTGSLSLSLG